jgi:Putative zinc-finger
LNSREYISQFLSAHADGELTGAELRAAEAHVASCPECAARLAEERALKSVVRKHAAPVATPVGVRTRLLTLLAEEAARGEGAMASESDARRGPSHERGIRALRRPAVWIPLSLAAVLAFAFVAVQGLGLFDRDSVNVVYRPGGSPEFDTAVAYFEKFDHHFAPNVPSDTYGDIAGAYVEAHMPGDIWNFNGSGLTLVGGRLDKLPDSRLATFTFYKGAKTSLLCTRYKVSEFIPPPGAVREMADHLFYSYHGYSICYSYSPVGKFVCLLITRQPVTQLLDSVEYALE